MNRDQLLKTLVVANIVCAFASVGAEAFFGWTLPPALADYTRSRFTSFAPTGPGGGIAFLLILAGAACAIAAWIGLLGYRRSSRRLLLASLGLSILHALFAGPSVRSSVGAMFGVMDAVASGLLIGLVYFSDLASRFEPRATTGSPVAPERLSRHRA